MQWRWWILVAIEEVFSSRGRMKILRVLAEIGELNVSEIARRAGLMRARACAQHTENYEKVWNYWGNRAMGLCTTCKNSQLLKGLGRNLEKVYTSFLHLIITYHLNAKWIMCLKPVKASSWVVGGDRKPRSRKNTSSVFPALNQLAGAARLLGRKVGWPVGKHEARGKIVALHGKNGLVRARFRKGMPGQALGSLVEIIGWIKSTCLLCQ